MILKTDELTPQQYKALTLISCGRTNIEVSREMDLSVKTLEDWRKLPTFKKLLRQALTNVFDAAIAELTLNAQLCARELTRIALAAETPERTKITAIMGVLNLAAKGKDLDLEARFEEIERRLNDTDKQESFNISKESAFYQ